MTVYTRVVCEQNEGIDYNTFHLLVYQGTIFCYNKNLFYMGDYQKV